MEAKICPGKSGLFSLFYQFRSGNSHAGATAFESAGGEEDAVPSCHLFLQVRA